MRSALALAVSVVLATPSFAQDATAPTPAPAPAATPATPAVPPPAPPVPLTGAELDARLAALVQAHAGLATLIEIGRSREGHPLHVVRLGPAQAADATAPEALLVVAGIDGRHQVGVETAVRVAEHLANDEGELLKHATVYVLPCVNPDAILRWSTRKGVTDFGGTLSQDDLDRDGRTDEDPAVDLNADGYITNLLVLDPPVGIEKTHVKDPLDPRLVRKAEREKGERPAFAVMSESNDADHDGRFGEDGPEGVDLDKNFPHAWPEHADHAGPFALSEPESHALAKWMLERPDIAAVLVFGPGDNLVNVPEAGKKDAYGVPLGLEQDDLAWHQEVAKIFTKITGMKSARKLEPNGSFAAWAYAQFGVPTFTTPVWSVPVESKESKDGKDGKEGKEPKEPAKDAASAPASTPASGEAKDGKEGKDAKDGKDGKDERKRGDEEKRDLALITDADARGKFVKYAPFTHPVLGACEIGGLVPGAAEDAPASEFDRLGQEQTKFVVELVHRLPSVQLAPVAVKKLGDGAWRITLFVVNDGGFPTASAMGLEVRRLLPTVFRIEVPEAQLLGGTRVQRSDKVDGGGGRARAEWIVTGAAGSSVAVTVRSAQLGEKKLSVTLAETGP